MASKRRGIQTPGSRMKVYPAQPISQTPQRAEGSWNCWSKPLIRDSSSLLVSPPPVAGATRWHGMIFTTRPQHTEDQLTMDTQIWIISAEFEMNWKSRELNESLCQHVNVELRWHDVRVAGRGNGKVDYKLVGIMNVILTPFDVPQIIIPSHISLP